MATFFMPCSGQRADMLLTMCGAQRAAFNLLPKQAREWTKARSALITQN